MALDKLDKIGIEKVKEEMLSKGISSDGIALLTPLLKISGDFKAQLKALSSLFRTSQIGREGLSELEFIADKINILGLKTATLKLDITLARGLNYYTVLFLRSLRQMLLPWGLLAVVGVTMI